MIYTCVATEIKETRGQQYAVLWFKIDPENVLEKPIRICQFGQNAVDAVIAGAFWRHINIEVVDYQLPRKMKYPNGTVVNSIKLNCIKVPIYEETAEKLGCIHYVKSIWAAGYSPAELAAVQMHYMCPVEEE